MTGEVLVLDDGGVKMGMLAGTTAAGARGAMALSCEGVPNNLVRHRS